MWWTSNVYRFCRLSFVDPHLDGCDSETTIIAASSTWWGILRSSAALTHTHTPPFSALFDTGVGLDLESVPQKSCKSIFKLYGANLIFTEELIIQNGAHGPSPLCNSGVGGFRFHSSSDRARFSLSCLPPVCCIYLFTLSTASYGIYLF